MKELLNILYLIKKTNFFFLILILFLIFIGSILEVISLGSIVPGIQLLFNDEQTYIIKIKEFFSNYNINTNADEFIVFYFGILIILFLVKNTFLIFINWMGAWYVGNLRLFITREYYKKILDKNYEFHLKHSSSKFIRDIIGEINAVCKNIIFPILTTVLDIFTLLGIILFSSFINLKITLITFFFIIISAIIFTFIFKNKFKKYGKFRHEKEATKLKNLIETLRSIKLVIFEGKKKFFLDNFMNADKFTLRASIINSTILNSIRYFFETILIITLFFIIFTGYLSDTDIKDTIAIVTFLTVAFLRIFPSLNKFTVLINNLNFYKATINHISEIINEDKNIERLELDNNENINFKSSIKFKEISFGYNESKKVLNNISFEIKKNQFVVISGKNGSGKSTLISIFLGLLQLQRGEILVDEKKINTNSKIWRSLISFVPQETLLFDASIKKNILFADDESSVDEKHMEYVLDLVGLNEFVDKLPNKLETSIGEAGTALSGGQRQKLILARALYKKSKILVFDEPTSFFDTESENIFAEVMSKLKNKYTILIVSHSDMINSKADKIIKLS